MNIIRFYKLDFYEFSYQMVHFSSQQAYYILTSCLQCKRAEIVYQMDDKRH